MSEIPASNVTQKFGNVSAIQQNETVGFLDGIDQELIFGAV